MGTEAVITIDNHEVHCQEGTSILSAADAAGIYIPRLCYHPDLPPGPGTKADPQVYRHDLIHGDGSSDSSTYHGCNICIVEIAGKGVTPSCTTPVENGMVIHSETPAIQELRRTNLAHIIALHPHACLLCSENDGCDRGTCPQGEVEQGRCCPDFGNCEFQKVSEYVTIQESVSQYVFKDIPVVDTPFFTVNSNLCIGCTRCIRVCEKLQGKRVIGFTRKDGEFILGTTGPSHKESECVFCGGCVTVCPTGAHADKGHSWPKRARLNLTPVVLPPEKFCEFTKETVLEVPEVNGVFQLFDEKKKIIYIRGTDNLRSDLLEGLQTAAAARFFCYEEHAMYSMRENELLQQFLKINGTLPEVNDEISDLY